MTTPLGLGMVQAFSQAAAGGLVSAVWQGVLLAAAAGLGLRLLPKTPAAVRFAIWFAVFGVVAALPVASFWPHGAGVARADGHGPWLTIDARWSLAVATVWVLASLLRAAALVVAAFRVRGLWRRAEAIEVLPPTRRDGAAMNGAPVLMGSQAHVSEARRGAPAPGLFEQGSRRAQICVSDEVERPSVIGFFAPKILIPRWLLERLTPAELEQIVLHEAGHLGRADDWLNLAQKIALVIFPLNPALAWVERRLCFERELACDERVLRATGAPKAYASCLTALAERQIAKRRGAALGLALGIAGALGRESELARRVGRILRFGGWMRPMQARLVLGGAMVGLLVSAAELARCPQVVGFAVANAEGSQIAAGRAPARAMNGIKYEAVVFRPDEARVQHGLKPTHRDGAAMNGAHATRGTVVRRHSNLREVAAQDGPPSNSGGDVNSAQSPRGMQWVVMTSWDGVDGSRVFLTTAGASGEMQRVPQVHRYAAVPTQDGWLVFLL